MRLPSLLLRARVTRVQVQATGALERNAVSLPHRAAMLCPPQLIRVFAVRRHLQRPELRPHRPARPRHRCAHAGECSQPPCNGYKALEITRLQVVCGLGKLPLPAHPFSKIIHVPGAAAEKTV